MVLLNIILVAIYSVLQFSHTHLFFLELIRGTLGFLLLFFIPGLLVKKIIFKPREFLWYENISLSMVLSFFTTFIFYFLLKSIIGYDGNKIILLVLSINLLLTVIAWGFKKITFRSLSLSNLRVTRADALILAMPLIFFVFLVALNPFASERDTLLYINLLKDIIRTGSDWSFLSSSRGAFSFLILSGYHVIGWGYNAFFIFAVPLFYVIGLLPFYSVCSKLKNTSLKALSYWLVLTIPAASLSAIRVRPESLIYVLAPTILMLAARGFWTQKMSFLSIAFLLSFYSIKIHETAFLIFSVISIIILVACVKLALEKTKLLGYARIFRHKWIGLLIVCPYILLLIDHKNFLLSLLNNPYLKILWNGTIDSILKGNWSWWFLDNYQTIDGGKIVLPGFLGAIYYYIHNGAAVIFLLIICIIMFRKNIFKRTSWTFLTPLILTALVYFLFTEILPRLGVPLLPDRIWSFIPLSSIPIMALILKNNEKGLFSITGKFLAILLAVTVFCSCFYTVIASENVGNFMNRKDKLLANEINKTEQNAIIISTQPLDTIVELYGKREFIGIDGLPDQLDSENIVTESFASLEAAVTAAKENIDKSVSIEQDMRLGYYMNNNFIFTSETKESITDFDQKMEILRAQDRVRYEHITESLNNIQVQNRPIYLIYSFDRLLGLRAKSISWLKANDITHQKAFDQFSGPNVLKKNGKFIMIKIN